jgi:cytoskeletal protein CcmA (bactofilin family)
MKKEKTFSGQEAFNAFLGEGTSFKGILSFEGMVRIDGHLEGEVYTKDTLVVGETAEVSAKVQAGTVIISGTINGDITAEKKVEIHASGKLFGNISTPLLSIEEGVTFEGKCTMGQKAALPPETEEEKEELPDTIMT